MKKTLRLSGILTVGCMLFGLFFGAGNLIFPAFMGQNAGKNIWPACIGFLITGVGIPLLSVAALGMSRSDGLLELSGKVGRGYGYFFTTVLYLTIGPFFAIPRCASTSFSVGILPALSDRADGDWLIWLFSLAFFAAVLFFSLKPGKLLTWVGKVLTPLFLVFLAVLVVTALIRPIGSAYSVEPAAAYADSAFFRGFLEGYNTMDVLAGLAFGIVVVNAVRQLGVTEPSAVAGSTLLSGVVGCLLMAAIYAALTLIGAQSRAAYPVSADGGEALHLIAKHYFGPAGAALLAVIVTLACLKTAVGLIASCGEIFTQMLPKGPGYRFWAIGFCVISFLIATLGLGTIISFSLPVLMFLYPLAITLTLLALMSRLFGGDRRVYVCTTVLTIPVALLDLVTALPASVLPAETCSRIKDAAASFLPFADIGLGWICPAALGFVLGLIVHFTVKRKAVR